jgi:hypothetical protein
MFKDEHRYDVWNEIGQHDIRAFSRHLTPAVLAEAAKCSGLNLVKSPLCLVNLVWLGIAAALHNTKSFACVLTATLRLLQDHEGFANTKLGKAQKSGKRRRSKLSKHDPRRNDPTEVTEEAFAKARQRMPLSFWLTLIVLLSKQFERDHGERLRFRDFRVLAMDGTRLNLPEAKALRNFFGTSKNAHGDHRPQARMMLFQFPFVRLPYRYELSPVSTGEVTQSLGMMHWLCPNDLVLLDAGFLSYGLLWGIQNRKAFFAIRLGRKVCLKTVRRLNANERLVRWTPKDSRGQWRKAKLPKSIDLRVVEYRIPGFRRQAILTNVLSPGKISQDDWTRLTTACGETGRKLLPGLFHRRWEIETTYHELKVDQGLDRHLRSHTPASIHYEVAGHVVLYLLVRWLIVEAAVKHGLDPLRVSFLHALEELEAMHAQLVSSSLSWVVHVLLPRLLDRIAEHQVPLRPGRHYPRCKKKNSTKKPKTKSRTKLKNKG